MILWHVMLDPGTVHPRPLPPIEEPLHEPTFQELLDRSAHQIAMVGWEIGEQMIPAIEAFGVQVRDAIAVFEAFGKAYQEAMSS